MIGSKVYSYKGFDSKGAYLKNSLNRFLGKKSALSKSEEYELRAKKAGIKSAKLKKLNEKYKSEFGSGSKAGKVMKVAGMVTSPIAAVPIPGTVVIPAAFMGAGAALDEASKRVKMAKDPRLKVLDNQRKIEMNKVRIAERLKNIREKHK